MTVVRWMQTAFVVGGAVGSLYELASLVLHGKAKHRVERN